MDPLRTALLVVALPAAFAVAIAVVGRRGRLRHRGALAIAAASAAGAWAAFGAPSAWPVVVTDRYSHLIAAGLIAAIVGTATRSRLIASAAVALAAVAAVLGPLLDHKLAGVAGLAGFAIASLALLAIHRGLAGAGRRDDRLGLCLAGLSIAAASAAAGLSGSVVIAQLGGATAAGIGGLWLVSLRDRGDLAASAAPVIAIAVWAVIAMAVLYASMSMWTAALLIALANAGSLPLSRKLPQIAIAAALTAAVAASAIAPSTSGDDGADDYGYGYE